MQLRALHILTVKFSQNGIAAFAMNVFRAMPREAVCIDFVAPNLPMPGVLEEITARGGRVFVLPNRNRNPVSYARALKNLIQQNGYDLIHAHGNSATLYVEMLAARLAGVGVRIAHSHNTACKKKLADKLLRPFFYTSYTHAMACGSEAGEWLFPGRPFTVIQNAVDPAVFAFDPQLRAQVRTDLSCGDAPVVCHVGTFNDQKNHSFLLTAFEKLHKKLPDAQMLLVGSGPLLEVTKAQAQTMGLFSNLHFIGEVESAVPYWNAADVFVLPSRYEGLPFTLIEAQCAGLPCLVSEAVTKEAFLTPDVVALPIEGPEAADRWADALERTLRAPRGAQARMDGSALAAKAAGEQGFSIEKTIDTLIALYRHDCQEAEA